VTAEDIGKLPDSDVGQSLGRIPGIAVGRDFGQGASVSIRGTDPQMTYTTLNGQTVASTGWYDQKSIDRSFNYSLLPPELIGGMEVYKSSQANLPEGGIGGTVIVKTRKPLDLKPNTAFVSAKYGKGSVSGPEKELSGLYSFRNDSKTFGVLVAAAGSNADYIRKGIEADGRWGDDFVPSVFVQDRKRTALNVGLQAKPSADFELGASLLKLSQTGDNSNTTDYLFPNGNCTKFKTLTTKADGKPDVQQCTEVTWKPDGKTFGFFQTWNRNSKMTSDSLTVDGKYKLDGARFEFVAGITKAEGGTSLTTLQAYLLEKRGFVGTVNAEGKQVTISPVGNANLSVGDLPPGWGVAQNNPGWSWDNMAYKGPVPANLVGKSLIDGSPESQPNKDQEKFAQVDATFDLEWGAINSFKTGVRLADHTYEKRKLSGTRIAFDKASLVNTADLYPGTISNGYYDVPKINRELAQANALANIDKWIEDRGAYSELNEKNTSVYGMFDFEAQNMKGNFGLRYVSTKATSTGYKPILANPIAGDLTQNATWSATEFQSTDATYNDVLPSVNIAFDLRKDLVLRASASQTVTRPNFENMLGLSVSGLQDTLPGNETYTIGNVGLKPMKSTNTDLGIEYYYGKGNLISATYFNKDINNFVTAQVLQKQKVGLVSPDTGKDEWTVANFKNSGGGRVQGLELQANHTIGDGFGVIANYTFTDGTAPAESFVDKVGVFTLASKHNANLVGYFENDQFTARLAYNWRSKYMVREEPKYYGNRYHDAFGSLDANFGWNVTDSVKIGLEVVNILAKDDIQYGAADASTDIKKNSRAGFPIWTFKGDRTFKLGVSAKF
jgi:iron complex outermembrane receptor protein